MDFSVLINPAPSANATHSGNRTTDMDGNTANRGFAEQLAAADTTASPSTTPSGPMPPSVRGRPGDSGLATETPADSSGDTPSLAEALLVPVPIHLTLPMVPDAMGASAPPPHVMDKSFATQPLPAQQQSWLAGVATVADGAAMATIGNSLDTARERLQLMADANGRPQIATALTSGTPQSPGIPAPDPTTSLSKAMIDAPSKISPPNALPMHPSLAARPQSTEKLAQRDPPQSSNHPLGTAVTQTATSSPSHISSTPVPAPPADTISQMMARQPIPGDNRSDRMASSTDTDSDLFSTSLAQLGPVARSAIPATIAGIAPGLSAHIDSPEWPKQLGHTLTRIGIAANSPDGDQRIELRLHPAELGPLSVSLRLGEHGAQAQFVSAHPHVRQAVEQALPQLREILSEQGIQLGQASVSDQGQAQQDDSGEREGTGPRLATSSGHGDATLEEGGLLVTRSAPLVIDGRVDLYA